MKFLARAALGAAGFLALELATRPPAAGGIGLGIGGMGRLRDPEPVAGVLVWPEPSPELVEERRALCLSPCCSGTA